MNPSRRQFLASMAALAAAKTLPKPVVEPPPRLQFHRDAFSFVWPTQADDKDDTPFLQSCVDKRVPIPPGDYHISGMVHVRAGQWIQLHYSSMKFSSSGRIFLHKKYDRANSSISNCCFDTAYMDGTPESWSLVGKPA